MKDMTVRRVVGLFSNMYSFKLVKDQIKILKLNSKENNNIIIIIIYSKFLK